MPSLDSKNSFASLRDKILAQSGKQYWRSIEEHADTPEFRELISQEYPHEIEEWDNSLSRRNFVKVMGASLALAGLSGCVIQPPEKIVPYVRPQEGMLPGKPLFFATAMSIGGVATGLLAKAFDGRPIKVEGNPDHPGSRGSTDVLAQASILGMYDPDRSQEVTYRGTAKSWPVFMTDFRAAVDENRKDGGAGVRFLTETVTSPTLIDQMNRVKAEFPNSKWVQYEPVNSDNAMAGAKLAFGTPAQAVYKFNKANRILTLGADLFSGFNVAYIKDFAEGRAFNEESKDMNRLYSVETTVSITGAKADHRLAIKPSQMAEVAKAIAKAVGVDGATSTYTENGAWISAMAKDLMASKGKSIVVAGDDQLPVVHALAHAMNSALGNVGQTVTYIEPLAPGTEKLQIDQFRELIGDIDAGRVKVLVILGGNPVYNSPADLKLNAERMNKIGLRVHLGLHSDETAELCHWHVDEKHFLEGWSDSRAFDGTANIIQPVISPLYDGRNAHELVQLFFKENFDKNDHDIVKEFWQKTDIKPAAAPAKTDAKASETPVTADKSVETNGAKKPETATAAVPVASPPSVAPKNFEDNWRKSVHDGFIPGTASAARLFLANLTRSLPAMVQSRSSFCPIRVFTTDDFQTTDGCKNCQTRLIR
jgi:molybdopterin-containing oxidoreductase family iron-sulfur binding subunit